jgi:hypothetical protein
MCRRTELASLKDDEEDGTDDWDEVEREIHQVPNDGAGRELLERLGHLTLVYEVSLCLTCSSYIEVTY